jgi:23S rRNA (adenine2030-N6)-methyltransferase
MNYRHIYHAGNFADVMKHCILISLVQAMQRKEKPFCYVDTHAGIGYYDLYAQKQAEHSIGISKLVGTSQAPKPIMDYLELVKKLNADKTRYYPGSPYLVRQMLRQQDRMVLCELHKQDAQALKNLFKQDPQVAVHQQDGYLGLKAFLPPQEKRGLILIDPPFEQADEFKQLLVNLTTGLARFAQGVYCLWYPLKDLHSVQRFKRQLQSLTVQNILCAELAITDINPMLALSGSGVIIVNAPWQLESELAAPLSWLWSHLSLQGRGFQQLAWLVPPA